MTNPNTRDTLTLTCIDGPDGCDGPVEWGTTPDRDDFRAFTRCRAHYERRCKAAEEHLRKYPVHAPADFDPLYAGETWDEDPGGV